MGCLSGSTCPPRSLLPDSHNKRNQIGSGRSLQSRTPKRRALRAAQRGSWSEGSSPLLGSTSVHLRQGHLPSFERLDTSYPLRMNHSREYHRVVLLSSLPLRTSISADPGGRPPTRAPKVHNTCTMSSPSAHSTPPTSMQ